MFLLTAEYNNIYPKEDPKEKTQKENDKTN